MHACTREHCSSIHHPSMGADRLAEPERHHESLKPQQDGRREVLFVASSLSLVTLCIGSGSVSPACCWSGWRQRGRPVGLLRAAVACMRRRGITPLAPSTTGSRRPQRKQRRRRRRQQAGAPMRPCVTGCLARSAAAPFSCPSLPVFSGFLSPTHLHLLAAHAHTRSSAAAWPVAVDTFAGFLRRWATGLERRAAAARRLALVYVRFFMQAERPEAGTTELPKASSELR